MRIKYLSRHVAASIYCPLAKGHKITPFAAVPFTGVHMLNNEGQTQSKPFWDKTLSRYESDIYASTELFLSSDMLSSTKRRLRLAYTLLFIAILSLAILSGYTAFISQAISGNGFSFSGVNTLSRSSTGLDASDAGLCKLSDDMGDIWFYYDNVPSSRVDDTMHAKGVLHLPSGSTGDLTLEAGKGYNPRGEDGLLNIPMTPLATLNDDTSKFAIEIGAVKLGQLLGRPVLLAQGGVKLASCTVSVASLPMSVSSDTGMSKQEPPSDVFSGGAVLPPMFNEPFHDMNSMNPPQSFEDQLGSLEAQMERTQSGRDTWNTPEQPLVAEPKPDSADDDELDTLPEFLKKNPSFKELFTGE